MHSQLDTLHPLGCFSPGFLSPPFLKSGDGSWGAMGLGSRLVQWWHGNFLIIGSHVSLAGSDSVASGTLSAGISVMLNPPWYSVAMVLAPLSLEDSKSELLRWLKGLMTITLHLAILNVCVPCLSV